MLSWVLLLAIVLFIFALDKLFDCTVLAYCCELCGKIEKLIEDHVLLLF